MDQKQICKNFLVFKLTSFLKLQETNIVRRGIQINFNKFLPIYVESLPT